jgi:uridine kinase
MLEDVLLITDADRQVAQVICEEVLKRRRKKYIIAISGESGSGKSELTNVLAKELKKHGVVAKPLHIDNFYKTLPLERTAWRTRNGIEHVVGYDEYDWEKIYTVLDDFRNDGISTMPCVDLITEHVDKLTTDFTGIEMLIIDGLYAIKTEGADMRIYLERTYQDSRKAQLLRGKEPQNEYRTRVLLQEHKMVTALKEKANILVSKEYEVTFLTS